MEDSLRCREEGWKEENATHEDQLKKLSTLTKERENSWQKQKQEMEEHYQQLITEMQARVKVSCEPYTGIIIQKRLPDSL